MTNMRIARYPLAPQTYQTVEPLWPGTFVAVVVAHQYDTTQFPTGPVGQHRQEIELHLVDNHDQRTAAAPIIGLWQVTAGQPFPDEMIAADAYHRGTFTFHGTPVHLFTAVIGYAETTRSEPVKADTVDQMAEAIAAKHRARRGPRVDDTGQPWTPDA